jgi:hypothetical protein
MKASIMMNGGRQNLSDNLPKRNIKIPVKMEFIKIKNSQENISTNFRMIEFFRPSLTRPELDFELPKCLLDSVQHFRTVWGLPIKITSVYRPTDKTGSKHKLGHAVDFVTETLAIEYIEKFKTMCINHKTSQMFKELRVFGLNGFGIESGNCIHLDWRKDEECASTDEYGRFIIFTWDKINGSKVIY